VPFYHQQSRLRSVFQVASTGYENGLLTFKRFWFVGKNVDRIDVSEMVSLE
jgi:hypothetical protein